MDPSNDYGNSIIFVKQLQIELVVMCSGLPKFINSWKKTLKTVARVAKMLIRMEKCLLKQTEERGTRTS